MHEKIIIDGKTFVTAAVAARMTGKSPATLSTARCNPEKYSDFVRSLRYTLVGKTTYYDLSSIEDALRLATADTQGGAA